MHKQPTISLVVFDMAGTTINEDNVVYKTLRTTINQAGFDFSLNHVLEHGAGKEKLTAIQDIMATAPHIVPAESADRLYELFSAKLATAYNQMTLLPQAGAEELFTALHALNIKVVLNTGYNYATASGILDKLQWQVGRQIDGLVTASDVSNNRPYPDMIVKAMHLFGIADAASVIKVGDSIIDIEEGKNAGCGLSIGITTGAHTRAQLLSAQPDFIIDHLHQLLPLIP